MRTLNRYVLGLMAVYIAVALLALLAVFSVLNTMQELELVGTGRYGLAQVAWVVIMTLPAEAYELFPAAALIAGVGVVGTLAARNELTPIWSAGISPWRVVGSVLQAAGVPIFAAMLAGELVAAPLAQRAESARALALTAGTALSNAKGFWARDGLRYLNLRSPPLGDELRQVYIYEFDQQHRLQVVTYAKSASYAGKWWQLHELTENRLSAGGIQKEEVAERLVPTFMSEKQLRLLQAQPEYLSLADLWRSVGSLRERGESSRRYELGLWKRATMPAVSAMMIFLSVPFVLVAAPALKTGERVAAGALLGIGFRFVDETFGQLGLVYGISPIIGALLPAMIAFLVALWLMRKAV